MKKRREDIVIRKATIDDISVIRDIQKGDGFDHAYYLTEGRLKALFKRGELFFIALIDGQPAGFTSVDIEIRARHHFLSVKKNFQKMGVGSALLRRVIKECKEKEVKLLFVYVESNSLVAKFLLHKGFKKVGYFEDRFGKGKNAEVLSLCL